MDEGKLPLEYKNISSTKISNQGNYLLPERIEVMFAPAFTPGPSSKKSASTFKVLSQYILQPEPLHICYLDKSPKLLRIEYQDTIASKLLPSFSHFPIPSKKACYYYELILQDTGSCIFTHKFHGEGRSYLHYQTELFQASIAHSKAIIIKVISFAEYGDPNAIRRLSNVIPA